jgi:hypothetical protein
VLHLWVEILPRKLGAPFTKELRRNSEVASSFLRLACRQVIKKLESVTIRALKSRSGKLR